MARWQATYTLVVDFECDDKDPQGYTDYEAVADAAEAAFDALGADEIGRRIVLDTDSFARLGE